MFYETALLSLDLSGDRGHAVDRAFAKAPTPIFAKRRIQPATHRGTR